MKRVELKKLLILFIVGFVIYIAIEVLWTATQYIYRDLGSSHMSLMGGSSIWMGVLGGFIFIILGLLNENTVIRERFPLSLQALIGAVIITTLEFITGIILNVWLDLNIWDYEGFPLAHLFYNQINLVHSLCWLLLAPTAFWLDDLLRWVFYKVGYSGLGNNHYSYFWYMKHLFKLTPPRVRDAT